MSMYANKNNHEMIEELRKYLNGDVFINSFHVEYDPYYPNATKIAVNFVVFDNKKSAPFGAPKYQGETTTESEPLGSTPRIGNQRLLVKGTDNE